MMQASFFRLSPLLLLAAALVALAVFFAPAAQHAQASSLWSATLTVKEVTTGLLHGCEDTTSGSECSTAATLTDNTFTFGGVDYVIKGISVLTGGTLTVKLDKAIPDSLDTLVLYVGGEARLVWADGDKSTGTITNDSIGWESTGLSWAAGDRVALAMTNERPPSPLRRVSLSVAGNTVDEGLSVVVFASLLTPAGDAPGTLASDVTIPLTLTAGTAESGDYGGETSITISAGSSRGNAIITTAEDTDADDETFTVSLGDLSAVENVTSGPVTSVQVRITDDEAASPGTLSVDTGFGNPACGSAITTSETPEWALVLSPAPSAEEPTEYRVLADANGAWRAGVPVLTSGSSVFTSNNTFGGLRAAYPGFRGFGYRLADHPEVTVTCTWTTGGV